MASGGSCRVGVNVEGRERVVFGSILVVTTESVVAGRICVVGVDGEGNGKFG